MKTSYFAFHGGTNTDYPALSIAPGELISSQNYEAAVSGGYRRIDGFERYDGRTAPSSLNLTDYADDAAYQAAVEVLRSNISAVPGEGNILGVYRYNDVTYAFRNAIGGASAKMYKSSAAGWVEVTTGVTLKPNGHYEFLIHNFYSLEHDTRLYGCDGVNKAFEFDGTTYTEITTDGTQTDPPDTPTHIYVYKNRLFVSCYGGQIRYSSAGDPTTSWSAVIGSSGYITVGANPTGFGDLPSESFAIFTKNSITVCSGDFLSIDTTKIDTYSSEVGAIEWTIQRMAYPLFMNSVGLMDFRTTQAYGGFISTSLSKKTKKLIDSLHGTEKASVVSKKKNQYRVFYENNKSLFYTFEGDTLSGVMLINYGKTVLCCSNATDSDGTERVFFGSDDGYVYEMDKGTSFDGEEVVAYIRPSFNNFKSPEQLKRFFKVVLEIDAEQIADLTFFPLFDYGDPVQPDAVEGIITVTGSGGAWDEATWDEFYYDGAIISSAYGYLSAIGKNFSLLIRSIMTYEKPHTIQGIIIHYSPKGLVR